MGFTIDVSVVQKKLLKLAEEMPKRVAAALYVEANKIMTDSKKNYVPFDKGTLMRSGIVEEPEIGAGSVTVQMGYGGAAAPYALAIHEHPSNYDPPTWRSRQVQIGGASVTVGGDVHFRIGGPKYLERPFRIAKSGMLDRIAKRVKEAVQEIAK